MIHPLPSERPLPERRIEPIMQAARLKNYIGHPNENGAAGRTTAMLTADHPEQG